MGMASMLRRSKSRAGRLVRASTVLVFGALLGSILGCGSEPTEPGPSPQTSLEVQARDLQAALAVACAQAKEKATQVSLRSGSEALASAKMALSDAVGRLSEVAKPTPDQLEQLAELRHEIERIDAALLVQEIKAQWRVALEEGAKRYRIGLKDLAEARKKFRERDETFRALDDQLSAAERAYENAKLRLQASLEGKA